MPEDSPTPRESFPETSWSLVVQAQQGNPEQTSPALEQICERYWYPIYAFLRNSGKSSEDAEDLTQLLFQQLLARDTLQFADPAKGKLRSFLLANLKRVSTDEFRRETREKRGGGVDRISLDAASAEERYRLEPQSTDDPAEFFDRAWARDLVDKSMERLRERYSKKGRSEILQTLEPFISWNDADESYGDAAAKLGIKEAAVRVHVFRIRQRFRSILEEEVAETLADRENLEEEIRYLLSLAA